jgi:hypothetical protein
LTIYLKVWIWGKLLKKDNTRGRSLPKPLSSHSPPELRSGRERERERKIERENPAAAETRSSVAALSWDSEERERKRERERERTVAD